MFLERHLLNKTTLNRAVPASVILLMITDTFFKLKDANV